MNKLLNSLSLWFDTSNTVDLPEKSKSIDIVRCLPYLFMHLACLGVFWVGISPAAVIVCLTLYAMRVFALTAFYHRYFSHRAFKTSRVLQFIFAFVGASAAQRGPLWWAAHHRFHHKHSDTQLDHHSPSRKGFLHSHTLWFLESQNFATNEEYVKDFAKYPELVFLNRYDLVAPITLATLLYIAGGWQFLIWGFFISTVLVYQVTFLINSLAHVFGTRRYETADQSRNNWLLALLTFGEGWHNNHHYYPSSARQGFLWYQLDITYLILKLLSLFGLVWDLRSPPPEIIHAES